MAINFQHPMMPLSSEVIATRAMCLQSIGLCPFFQMP